MGDTLLTYEVKAETGMIHASPAEGEASYVTLSIKVTNKTNPHQPIECQSIRLDFPKGTSLRDLFSDESEITLTAPPHWTFTQSGAAFTAKPGPDTRAGNVANNTLVFTLANIKVNQRPGISEFTITEETGSPRRTGTRKITLAKFPADRDTLLSYGNFVPDSLEISPQYGDPTLGEITISISNQLPDTFVNCRSISFDFLSGQKASDFCSDATGIETTVDRGWDIRQVGHGGLFTATPSTSEDGKIGSRGLSFKFSKIKVNDQAGPTTVTITEVTDVDVNHIGSIGKNLNKTPLTLEIFDFRADPASIDEGANTVLTWSGTSGATYWIEYDIDPHKTEKITRVKGQDTEPLASTGHYTIEGLNRATTFRLYASMSGKERHREFPVDVKPARPKIKRFQGQVDFTSGEPVLILNWDTFDAQYCTIVDGTRLHVSGSYRIELKGPEDLSKTYTLTAWNDVGSVESSLKVNLRPTLIKSTSMPQAWGVAASPDGTQLYVIVLRYAGDTSLPGDVQALDPETLASNRTGSTAVGPPRSIAADDRRVYVTDNFNPQLVVLDALMNRIGEPVQLPNIPWGVAVSPHGQLYVTTKMTVLGGSPYRITHSFTGYLSVLNSQLQVTQTRTLDTVARGVAASSDGYRVYLGTDAGVLVLNASTLDSLKPVFHNPGFGNFGGRVVVGPAQTVLVSTSDDSDPILVLHGKTLQPIAGPLGNWVNGMMDFAVSPDYQYIYTVDQHTVSVFSAMSVDVPVIVASFTATPPQIDAGDDSHSFPVLLNWETVGATEILLNDQVITGTSKSVSIDKTTTFTLQAKGFGGPKFVPLTVRVIRPVKIDHFTASASLLYRTGNDVAVTLDWVTRNADQVTLNGEVVAGTSKTISLKETTQFTLVATGKNGPVSSPVTVTVKDVHLEVSRSGETITATFRADAGTYSVRFGLNYRKLIGSGYMDGTEDRNVVVTSGGNNQTVSAHALLEHESSRFMYLSVDVTVTGLPCGPVTGRLDIVY